MKCCWSELECSLFFEKYKKWKKYVVFKGVFFAKVLAWPQNIKLKRREKEAR